MTPCLPTVAPSMINCCTPRHAHQSVAVKLKDAHRGRAGSRSGQQLGVGLLPWRCPSMSHCIVAPAPLPISQAPPHPAPSISHISRTSAATLSQKPAITGELKTEEPLLELWNTVLGLPPPRRLPLLVDLYPFSQGLDIFSALGAPSCGFKALS